MKITDDTTLGEISRFMKRARFTHRAMHLGDGFIVTLRTHEGADYLGYGQSLSEALQCAIDRRMADMPEIDELIARSSLGTPEAVAARAEADPEAVKRVLERVDQIERDRRDEADARAIAHYNDALRNALAPEEPS